MSLPNFLDLTSTPHIAGMAAGIAALVKSIDPSVLVIGVEPTGANKMAISLKTGRRVSLDRVSHNCDMPRALKHALQSSLS
jgi:threonine dehydratase